MDRARKSLKGAGQEATVASRQIAKLAADGFGAVLPISFQAENAIERFIQTALKAQGALAILGKATLALGAGFAAFKLGSLIGEFAALGTSVKTYEENTKRALDEQKKLSSSMEAQRNVLRSLDKEYATLIESADELLRVRRREREEAALRGLPGGGANPLAGDALAKARRNNLVDEARVLTDQRKLREDNEQKLIDQITKERDEQVKKWREETQALADQLKTRLKLRQDFDAQFGQGGLSGQGAAGGLAAVRQLREQIQKEARDLAFAQREGLISETDATGERGNIRDRAIDEARRLKQEFGGLPVVLDAIDKAIASVEFGNFGREIATAREHLAAFVPTTQELTTGLGSLAAQFTATLPATDAAADATRAMSAAYLEAANAVYQLRVQLAFLAAEDAAVQQ